MQNYWPTLVAGLLCLNQTTVMAQDKILSAVIGQDGSQIVEQLLEQGTPTLPALNQSLLPLDADFPAFSLPLGTTQNHLLTHINQAVRLEHRHRNLTLEGVLMDVTPQIVRLQQASGAHITLPIEDFYVLPLQSSPIAKSPLQTYGKITYFSEALSWQPSLSLIIGSDMITLIEMARLQNQSAQTITLTNPLLQLSENQHQPAPQPKYERALMMSSDAPTIDYDNSEITFSLTDQTLAIAPMSQLLVPIQQQIIPIKNKVDYSQIRTSSYFEGESELDFQQRLTFKLDKNALSGRYNVFWQREQALLPSQQVQLEKLLANKEVQFNPNTSQDIIGQLKLINSSSRELPTQQQWQLTLRNLSQTSKSYHIEQFTTGLIRAISGLDKASVGASLLSIEGELAANEEKTLTYKVDLIK